jgi:hypothetical protein
MVPPTNALTAAETSGGSRGDRSSRRGTFFAQMFGRFRLSPATFGIVLLLGLFHLFLSRRPLWHTDLWGHLAYGRLIVADRGLPRTEPLMFLSQGVPFVDLPWLSQVLGYAAFRWEGIPALQFLYAASITACLGLLAYRTARRTGLIWPAVLVAVACASLELQQLVIRPQLAGLACFVLLFVYVTRQHLGWERWIVVPILFAAWANLHGSFVVGLALLATFAAGRGADVLRRTANLPAVWRDGKFRSLAILLLPAALAILLNPHGWGTFRDVWETASNPNLADLVEWRPLDIQMRQGQVAAAAVLGLIILYRLTPRRVSSAEFLLLIGLGGAALRTSRMIVWWAPVAAYYLAIHAAATWRQLRRERLGALVASPITASAGWAFAAAVTICGIAACTPLGIVLLHGPRTDPHESLSSETPLGATDYLNSHPPRGQIFNVYEWGDYLLWAGPKNLHVFVASHAHLVPTDVWQDYMQVISLRSGWEAILDRYGVNTAVLDPEQQEDLVRSLRTSDAWSLGYEDDRSVIFLRRHPK